MMTNLLFSQASALGKRLAMVLTMLLMLGVTQVWGETIYSNTGASGTTDNITASGNVNNNNGNPKPSFGGTSKNNNTFTFTGFDLSSYTNIQFTLDAAWTSFPNTTNTWPYVTFTTYLNNNVVYTNSTTITWSDKTTSYSTYTFSDLQQFDKVVLTISPAEGKSKNGNATTTYSCYIDNISITAEEGTTQPSVTLQPNGGTGTAKVLATTDGSLTLPECDFTYEGYRFVGWNTKAEGTGTTYQPSAKYTPTENPATLYAKWAKEYTVTYNANGGTTTCEDNNKYIAGEQVTVCTSAPTRDSYTFNGWSYSPNVAITDGQFAMPENDVTITAQWTSNKTTTSLSWSADTYSATIDADNTFPTLTKTPADLSPIAYSSSNTSVATIDANGNITLLKKGETTITTTFEETATHTGATDSYTLTVYSSNCRWVEAEIGDIQSGDEVVITMTDALSNSYTLLNFLEDKEVPDAIIISSTNSFIDDYIWIVGKDGENLTFESYKNRGNFLRCNNADKGIRIDNNATANRKFVVDDTYGYLKNTQTTKPRYLGVHNEDYTWYSYALTDKGNFPTKIVGQTLKFYKKTCLPADKYWINYNLSNVACTTDPKPISVNSSDSELRIFFEPVDGYQLPKEIEVKMGEQILDEESYTWDNTNGKFVIEKSEDISFSMGDVTISIIACKSMDNPADLRTNVTSTTATLSWNTVENAQNYTLLVISDDDISYSYETTLSETTCLIKGLTPNTTYLWEVVANGVDGYCDTHTDDTFTTLDVYTVTFNTNGGTAVASQTVDHGGKATKPANPTKTGYTFAGWYTEADAEFDFNTPIESATTLYAKWNANQYTITFLKQYGSGGTNNATVTFNSNNFSVVTIELPTRDGYEFGGYYTETGGAGLQIVDAEGKWLKNKTGYLDASGNWIKAESVNLYAKWTKIHTITWVVNNNTETPHHTSRALDGSTIDALPMPPADDLFEDCEVNAFVGWSTDNIGLEPDATAPTDLFKTIAEAQSKIGAINGDKKFYAVYASEIESTTTFKRVHELSELNTSSKIAIINAFNKTKYILPTSLEAEATTPSENLGEITIGDGQYWNIEKDGDNWKFKSGNKYLAGTTIPTNNNKIGALALRESEDNTTWTIVKNTYEENGTPVFTIYNTDNTTAGLEYSNGWILYYATDFNTSWFTLNLYIPRTTYSNYITRCTALPDPVWGGATIDKTEIAVNCGETSSTNGAAKISFLKETNFNLYKDITVEVTSGNFIIATSRDGEYSTSVTLTPTQSGTNVGTLDGKYVYVRAVAPAMSDEDFTGTITISGKQLAQDQVIEVTAEVSCTQYTLTFNDQRQTKTVEGFAGTSVVAPEPWAGICTEPIQYVFDGWATAPVTNGTEEYEKVDFSTFTMPNNNTTILYAVYRYAEEGGEAVNGYVKVTKALTDWSGDYVIVDDEFNVAIQNTYEEDTKDNKTLKDVSVTIENDKIVSPTNDIIWTISKSGEYYTVYNAEAIKYAGITKNATRAAGLSETIATGYSMNIIFDSNTKIAKVSSTDYNRCFSYSEAYPEWRTYSNNDANGKTGYLYRFSEKTIRYTSSLVCGSIEAENAIVTSTVGQTIKVYVPITLDSSTGATTINATSDNAAFAVTGLIDVEAGNHTIVVEYTPAEYNITETANITLSATNGATTTTFTVSGRSLPENFVIATKVGATWYALPANINGATNPEGVLIDVDETTMTATAPNTTVYTLFPVKTTTGSEDRYAQYGDRVRFSAVNNGYNGLWTSSSESTIRNYAVIDDVKDGFSDASYEWKVTTTIVDGNWQYMLQTDQSNNQKYLRYWTAASGGAKWGTYASGNDKLYFLPVTTYTDLDLEVMEWGTNSMVIRAGEDLPQNVNITINGTTTLKTLQNINGSDLYKIDDVTLTSDDCGTIIIDNGSNARKIIRKPLLVSGNKSGSEYTTSPGRDICAESDIVILNGGKLIADEAKTTGSHVDFANIYVYPGGKLVLDEKSLGVKQQVYLRGGYSWLNQSTYALPEVYLNGDINFNGSGNIIYDYYIQNYKYYQFALPYDVQLAKVTDEAGKDNFPVWVKHYNGALRAEDPHATSWEWYPSEDGDANAYFKAGEGYIIAAQPRQVGNTANRPLSIIRFPLGNKVFNKTNGLESDLSIPTKAHGIDGYKAGTVTANNVGWNFVGNPFLSTWQGNIGYKQLTKHPNEANWDGTYDWVDADIKYITIMSAESGSDYAQYIASETEFKPFFPFYLQETANGGSGTIDFAAANRMKKAPAAWNVGQEEREAYVQLEIATDAVADQTGVFVGNKYSDNLDFDDYEKIFGTSTELPKLWIMHDDKRMAFEAMTESTAATYIPLGYRAPKIGKYIFAINEEASKVSEVEAVYLTDNQTGVTDFDLLSSAYEFESNGELYNDSRFTIRIVLRDESSSTVTGVDNVLHFNSDYPYKFIYQDKMYILRNGVIYDAMGKQVQTINK